MKYVLFDLDGTLLPMDQDVFVNGYFGFLVQKMAPHGYEAGELIKAIWAGTAAMVKNDGTRTNEEAFWDYFTGVFGPSAREDIRLFEEFYAVDFQRAREFCGVAPEAAGVISLVRGVGAGPVRATTFWMPALMISRRHMAQGVVSGLYSPVTASRPTRYSVAPSMSRRAAEMMALASAWTLRHSS